MGGEAAENRRNQINEAVAAQADAVGPRSPSHADAFDSALFRTVHHGRIMPPFRAWPTAKT